MFSEELSQGTDVPKKKTDAVSKDRVTVLNPVGNNKKAIERAWMYDRIVLTDLHPDDPETETISEDPGT